VCLIPEDYWLGSLFGPEFLFISARRKAKDGVANSKLHENVREASWWPGTGST